MCEKCGHKLTEGCGGETGCGFCYGKALEKGTLPRIRKGLGTETLVFKEHTMLTGPMPVEKHHG